MTQTSSQEPTNIQRAQWAKAALAVFTAETFGGDHPDAMTAGDLEDAITDLICGLLHLAHFHPRMAATTVNARALEHFQYEVSLEEAGDCAYPIAASSHKPRPASVSELIDALDALIFSLSPRKIGPVLKAAGYSIDLWLTARKNAQKLLQRFRA